MYMDDEKGGMQPLFSSPSQLTPMKSNEPPPLPSPIYKNQ